MSYSDEVEELTDLVRNDENWADIREILIDVGFDPQQIVMAGFAESDDEREFGIFISKSDLKVFEYERSTVEEENNSKHINIFDRTGSEDFYSQQPHIKVALEMIGKNEI